MSYTFLDHTADLGIEVAAPSLDLLFAEALAALTDCLTERSAVLGAQERAVEVEGRDLELLLITWLEEAVYLFEVEELLLFAAEVRVTRRRDGWSLRARVAGEQLDASRHPLKVPIKGVTFHRLRVEQTADGWRARVIFDI